MVTSLPKTLGALLLATLFLLFSCEQSNKSTSDNNISTTDTLPTSNSELTIPTNHIALYGYLDDHLYLQLVDTTTMMTTERVNSPVYECACKVAGTCVIKASNHYAIACVPKGESCTTEPNEIPRDRGHKCEFKQVRTAAIPSSLQTVMTHAFDFYQRKQGKPKFNERGVGAENFYTIMFEDEKQLHAQYILNDGRVVIEYFPRNDADPVRVTCSCSCPGGDGCSVHVNTTNSISCYSKSSCMPETNGDPCDGCGFSIVDMTTEELTQQTKEKRLF